MPRIPQYTPQVQQVGAVGGAQANASSFGGATASALAGAGQALQGLGAKIDEMQTQREVSDVRAKMAQARADWTMRLTEASQKADPGDTEFSERFASELSNSLDDIGSNIRSAQARDVFNQLSSGMRSDLGLRAFANQAALMGEKAKLDAQTRIEQGRNTVLNDPTQFGSVMAETEQGLADMANLSPIDREKLTQYARSNVALSAVQGTIRANPSLAKQVLENGSFDKYLDADKKASLSNQADTAVKGQIAEQKRREAEYRAAREEARLKAADNFVELAYTNKLTVQQVLDSDLPATGANSKEHWIKVIESRAQDTAEAPVRTQPSAFSNVLNDIRSGAITSETEIEKYYTDSRSISWDDVKELRRELQDKRTPDGDRLTEVRDSFMKAMKPQIDKSNPLRGDMDVTGAADYYRFEHYVKQQVQKARDDKKDPYKLFDPNSPEYLGGAVSMFRKTLSESMAEAAKSLSSGPKAQAPRNAGESPADYLKRIGVQ